jgi:signal transduction histidine kinase
VRMGGTLELVSGPGETIFTLELPLTDVSVSHEIEADLTTALPPTRA